MDNKSVSPQTLKSTFSEFGEFLERLDHTMRDVDARFVGRNFRLDERIPLSRITSYAEVATANCTDFNEWNEAHVDYLASELWLEQPPAGLPRRVFPDDSMNTPESFRSPEPMISLSNTDPSVELVRVERIASIARAVGLSEGETEARLADTTSATSTESALAIADAILDRWLRTLDLRPVWAAFWEDCADILAGHSTTPSWPNEIRDALGLSHFDPTMSGRPVPIAVFRYPVRLVPTLRGEQRHRCIAYPTVLDGRFSSAFCPLPLNDRWGRAVDMSAMSAEPFREVIHPPVTIKGRHVYCVGRVSEAIPENADDARAFQLMWLQDEFSRSDFGQDTDSDLLK